MCRKSSRDWILATFFFAILVFVGCRGQTKTRPEKSAQHRAGGMSTRMTPESPTDRPKTETAMIKACNEAFPCLLRIYQTAFAAGHEAEAQGAAWQIRRVCAALPPAGIFENFRQIADEARGRDPVLRLDLLPSQVQQSPQKYRMFHVLWYGVIHERWSYRWGSKLVCFWPDPDSGWFDRFIVITRQPLPESASEGAVVVVVGIPSNNVTLALAPSWDPYNFISLRSLQVKIFPADDLDTVLVQSNPTRQGKCTVSEKWSRLFYYATKAALSADYKTLKKIRESIAANCPQAEIEPRVIDALVALIGRLGAFAFGVKPAANFCEAGLDPLRYPQGTLVVWPGKVIWIHPEPSGYLLYIRPLHAICSEDKDFMFAARLKTKARLTDLPWLQRGAQLVLLGRTAGLHRISSSVELELWANLRGEISMRKSVPLISIQGAATVTEKPEIWLGDERH